MSTREEDMKRRNAGEREEGSVLLFAILVVLLAMGFTGSLIMVGVADARVTRESTERVVAFSLAETGLQESKYEIGEDQDDAGDGIGNRTGSTSEGTFSVTAEDLGSDYWRLTSTAAAGSSTVRQEEVVFVLKTSQFPGGAISVVGGMETNQILFSATTDMLVDGGDSPGITFSDSDLYADSTPQFAEGVNLGYISESDIVGSVTNTFQPGNADLSIQHVTNSSISITDSMYWDLRTDIQNDYLPIATNKSFPGSAGNVVYGSPSSPVNYKFVANERIKPGQSISGYGNLVFSRNLEVEAGGSINWNGNIIIYPDDGNDSYFDIDGTVNVTGNIFVIGSTPSQSAGKNVRFLVKSQGNVTVNGALTVLTNYADPATQIQFLVENNLTVDGLVTVVTPKHQIEFKPGSDTLINGSLQVGRMAEDQSGTEFKMKFEDVIEIHKDNAQIHNAVNTLVSFGSTFGTGILENTLTSKELLTMSWRMLPED
jgi:hypothetical protein